MKIGLLYDSNLPFEGERPDKYTLHRLEEKFDIITCDNYSYRSNTSYDCIVNLHGCYFPKLFWGYIKRHLLQGKGLVNAGAGVPFSIPVSLKNGACEAESPQTAYHEELNIQYGLKVSKDNLCKLEANKSIPLLEGFENCFAIDDTVGLAVRFTKFKDSPHEPGSSGPMDANIFPLLVGISHEGRDMAAPVVLIENTKGEFEGGRWIFINQRIQSGFWANDGCKLLECLAEYSASGAYELIIRPNYASYYPGEQPELLIQGQYFINQYKTARIDITVSKGEQLISSKRVDLPLSDDILYHSLPLDFKVEKGIYVIRAEAYMEGEPVRVLTNGFWGYDKELLESGEKVTCGRDYFYRDGKPMPVVGMTYMQSDVHRKYLYLPNVSLWDRDFAEMKRAGINMVRTGIWTGFRTVMFNDGIASEEILRAIDAMLLTAKKHDIPIVFNFFAFTPELWEGCNPYLDPRSVKAQKRFISSIVSRHANSSGVMWDLINEPSVCNPRKIWQPAPNRDAFERAEWVKWLRGRHDSIEKLQERWNVTSAGLPSFEAADLPQDVDFINNREFTEPQKGLKILDYILFTQHIFNKWAGEMMSAIRAAGADQLVTAGQDEGLNAKRPSPHFYSEVVDYTTNHSWWQMDDLYWDSIFFKAPGKPNLIQETGIMYVKNADGSPRRNEAELRDILERKYAYAFAGNNAGAMQWIWNTNIYMDSLNEVSIGALRADGTQKPEASVSYDFGRFMNGISTLFEGRTEEETAVVYPYSNDFSVRDYANIATKMLVRVLGHKMGIPFCVLSEFSLETSDNIKLFILPSPRTLSQSAWETLLSRVENGCTLLVTGPFSFDDYWDRIESRASQLGLSTRLDNVCREETLYIDDMPFRATFAGNKIAWVDKELEVEHGKARLKVISFGAGKLIWSPLPVEMNENDNVIMAVYQKTIDTAVVKAPFEWISERMPGILGKKLQFAEGALYVFISENAEDTDICIKDSTNGKLYSFTLPANRAVLFAAENNGIVISTYNNIEITVK